MLIGTVSLPSLGLRDDVELRVPGPETYDREDVMVFAGRTIMIAAQAACRAAGETAANKVRKELGEKAGTDAGKLAITKAAAQGRDEWRAKVAPTFKVDRRDEEAAKVKKVARVTAQVTEMGADEAAKVLAAIMAKHPGLKVAPGAKVQHVTKG